MLTKLIRSVQPLTLDLLDLKMAKKRIRIDMEDADGARYDIKSVSYTHLTLPTKA